MEAMTGTPKVESKSKKLKRGGRDYFHVVKDGVQVKRQPSDRPGVEILIEYVDTNERVYLHVQDIATGAVKGLGNDLGRAEERRP